MNLLLLNLLLALAWVALTGNFQPIDFAFGFGLGYLVLWLFSPLWGTRRYFTQMPRLVDLAVYFLFDMLRANLRLAVTILSPKMNLRPAVVAVPLTLRSETAIILLTNLITLTPGTLTLDISSDRRMLYIHTVWLEDVAQFRRQVIEGYERRVKELFEP
ncbi:MAG: Na+/H+ antiporter subunit E [Chloroflexota bacterium]